MQFLDRDRCPLQLRVTYHTLPQRFWLTGRPEGSRRVVPPLVSQWCLRPDRHGGDPGAPPGICTTNIQHSTYIPGAERYDDRQPEHPAVCCELDESGRRMRELAAGLCLGCSDFQVRIAFCR
jgi:hypothetical protein